MSHSHFCFAFLGMTNCDVKDCCVVAPIFVICNVKSNVYCDKLWRERGAALQCSRAGFGSLLGVQVEYWSSGSGRKSGICLIAKMGALEFGDKSAYCRNGSPGEIRTLVGG